jgi:hypothetical protein
VRDELAAETHGVASAELAAHAWGRIGLTDAVTRESLEGFVASAPQAGFLRNASDLARLLVQGAPTDGTTLTDRVIADRDRLNRDPENLLRSGREDGTP